MDLTGYQVKDPNFILRIILILFSGLICLGAVLFWQSATLESAEYQDVPNSQEMVKIRNENFQKQADYTKEVKDNLVY